MSTSKAARKSQYSRAPWAIYYLRDTPEDYVLLTDGAFTAERNCFMREFGHVWHKPRYFATRRAAIDYLAQHWGLKSLHTVRRYAGPTEPWERAA